MNNESSYASDTAVWPLALINGGEGYLADASVYDHGGGYELTDSFIWFGEVGPFPRDTAQRLVETWRDLSRSL